MTDNQEFREFLEWKRQQETQTIEKTGKDWKALQLGGVLLIIVGLIYLCIDQLAAGCILALGLALYVGGRVGAWWYHG